MYIQKWEQKAIFKKFQDNILVENDDFIRLLKVIGNNHKYDLRTQMSIATFKDTSTACADFNFWNNKANRFIRKYEVGIPVFNQDEEITGYIFDVSQTCLLYTSNVYKRQIYITSNNKYFSIL